ncbi:hypothetical protein ALP71_00581 [Pseudomonas coronafaciens pv. garcae]|nr:hypothetical protein ALP71_00581 [Pseudomonas coronafaciens pv. garcae]
MLVGFAGVMPEKLAFVKTRFCIELEVQRFDLGHAFQRMQVRTGAECRGGVCQRPALADQPGIPGSGQITGTGEHAASLFLAKSLDDFMAQRAKR